MVSRLLIIINLVLGASRLVKCFPIASFVAKPQYVASSTYFPNGPQQQRINKDGRKTINLRWSSSTDEPQVDGESEGGQTSKDANATVVLGVVAPLKYMGPYPCLALRFPNLCEQGTGKSRDDEQGVRLDFVLDTGANMNSIDSRLVDKLALPPITLNLDVLGTAGVSGSFKTGDYFTLGDCQLVGLPPDQNFTFMTNLTATALSHSSPVGAHGLLGLPFFASFRAGVEFDWYGTDGDPPTVIFYYGKELPKNVQEGMNRVPLKQLSLAQLLSLTINVNGTEMPALLDTGSPVTILNNEAAKLAGIEVAEDQNTIGGLWHKWTRKPAVGDNTLAVGGVDGGPPTVLQKSKGDVPIWAGTVSLGEGPVYVGNLPGLAVVNKILDEPLPAIVLGLDSLRRTYRMILRLPENEVWFEDLGNQARYSE